MIELEVRLEESKDAYSNLENSLSIDKRAERMKNNGLERKLEQLTLMYHQLVKEKSNIAVENAVNTKKTQRLNEKVKNLEIVVEKYKVEMNQRDLQIRNLQDEVERPYSTIRGTMGPFGQVMPNPKIRRTIKGGGNAKLLAGFYEQSRTYSATINTHVLNK